MSTTKKFNRGLALALILALVLCLLPVAAHAYSGGSGTQSAPYLIANATDLNSLRTAVNGGNAQSGVYFKLTADITTAQTTPIGNASGKSFSGHFDGDGHNIALGISTSSGTQGLFGRLNGATIENLSVSGSVTVNNTSRAGGIAGYATNSTIENCSNSANITAKGHAGGIVGYAEGTGTITGCFNTGTIYSSDTKAGGIVAEQYTNVTVSNCYNKGNVTGTSTAVGGIVGYSRGPVSNCYHAVGTISGSSTKGGIIGHMYSSGSITNCYYVAIPQGLAGVGNTTGGTELTASQMQGAASSLGNYYEADSNNINGGYPILYWQGSGNTPSTGIVDALNDLMDDYDEYIMAWFDEDCNDDEEYSNGDTIYADSVFLDPYDSEETIDNTVCNVYAVWTSSSAAVSVPSVGYGTATVAHSTSEALSVTLTAYLRTEIDDVTYTSTNYVRYTFTISRDEGEEVTRTVYVSIFNNKNAPNTPIVSGSKSGISRDIIAVPVEVSGYANTICVDDALQQLHTEYYTGTNGYVTSNGIITKLWGNTNTNNAFGIYRNDILTNTVNVEAIADGDLITAFTYKNTNSYSDRYLCFENTVYTMIADNNNNTTFTPTIKYKTYSGGNATTVTGSTLTVYKLNESTGALESAGNEVTVNNASVTVSPNVYGTYVLLAQHAREGWFSYTYYVPGVALLKVGMNDTTAVTLDKAALTLNTANGVVVSYVKLPSSGVNGSTITWDSLNDAVITDSGLVIRPAIDTQVTLRATISKGTATSQTKDFLVTVPAKVANDSSLLSTLTTTVKPNSASITSANIEENLWAILDVIAYEKETQNPNAYISSSEKSAYYNYTVSFISSVIASDENNDEKSGDIAKAMFLLKALDYDNSGMNTGYSVNNIASVSYNNLTKTIPAWLEYFTRAAVDDAQAAMESQDPEVCDPDALMNYLHTVAFVLIADMEEHGNTATEFQAYLRGLLLDNQKTDGSWTIRIDEDAMIMTALGFYKEIYTSDATVIATINSAITNSKSYLGGQNGKQLANGSFPLEYDNNIGNAQSAAFALIALVAVNENPEGSNFTNNGRTVVDGILNFYNPATGMFQYLGQDNAWATEQAYRALIALEAYGDNDPAVAYILYEF